MASRYVSERRKDGILVVRVVGELPTHRRMLHRQTSAHLSPSLATILTPIDAAIYSTRTIPILRRAMTRSQKHCRRITRYVNHVVKVITLHSFFGPLPSLFRRIRLEKAPRGGSKIFRFGRRGSNHHVNIRVFEPFTYVLPRLPAIETSDDSTVF